jgi:hypothetical protein
MHLAFAEILSTQCLQIEVMQFGNTRLQKTNPPNTACAALGFGRFVGEVRGGAACGVSVKRKPDRRRTELVEVS